MSNSNLFATAARMKLRFATTQGLVSVEDLWDLPLTSKSGKANLDDIYLDLHKKLKESEPVSLINKAVKSDDISNLKFEVVTYVITTKLAENEAAANVRATELKRQKLLQLIDEKQDEKLSGSSIEELQEMVKNL